MNQKNVEEDPRRVAQEKAAFRADEEKLNQILAEGDIPLSRMRPSQKEIQEHLKADARFNGKLRLLLAELIESGALKVRK